MIDALLAVKVPILTFAITLAYIAGAGAGCEEGPLTAAYLAVAIPLIAYGLHTDTKRRGRRGRRTAPRKGGVNAP